ncbi:MAG: DUF4397 domain-containing protein [Anaerolineales bacterium]|nr:DUF4397 domain-containing protein [Anaerolineales bacterium]MCB8953946.1 DUF4397 domain-containing protein [Ardenticatenales bacterium]
MKRLTIFLFALTALMALALNTAQAAEPTAADSQANARVRVAHASPDAPAVDVLVDGAVAFANIPFEEITNYAALPAGTYNIQVVPAGQPGPVVIEADLTLAAGTDYTVAAINTLANIEPLVMIDNNSLPAVGNAHVRFVHASPDAPAVDIAVANGGPVLFGNVAFGEVGDYLPVAATTYDLEVRIAGTNTVVLSLPGIALANRTVYTVFATGFALGGQPALNAVLVADAGPTRVRVVHASPDAPAVDVLVNGAAAFTNIPFEDVTDYAILPSGNYQVQVVPAGQPGPVVIDAYLDLEAGTDYTVAAVNTLANIEPLVLVDNNDLPQDGWAHVRFVHASPDAPAVDIAGEGGNIIFSNVAFKEATAYTPLLAGTYGAEVRLAGTNTVVLSIPSVTVDNQIVYTVFATGFALGGQPELNAVVSADAGAARVRVAHLSPDAPAVDVRVNGAVAFANVPFEEITDYAALPNGAYLVEVVPAGQPGPVVISAVLDLQLGTDYTVAAVNTLANIQPLVLVDDNTIPMAGKAHVRFLHASPDAPAVDIAVANGGPVLFSNIAFTEVGGYLPVDAGTYDLEVRLAGTNTVVLSLPGILLQAKTVYTVYATGFALGGTPTLNAVISRDAAGIKPVLEVNFLFDDGDGYNLNNFTLYSNLSFVDGNNDTGYWIFQPTNDRLYFAYNNGGCDGAYLGAVNGNSIAGLYICRDGSGQAGIWFGTVNGATAQLPVSNDVPASFWAR